MTRTVSSGHSLQRTAALGPQAELAGKRSAAARFCQCTALLLFGTVFLHAAVAGDARRSGGEFLTFARPSMLAHLRATSFAAGTAEERVAHGLALFMRDWLNAPRAEQRQKIGPRYDASACAHCHLELGDGRGGVAPLVVKPVKRVDVARFGHQINAHGVEAQREIFLLSRKVFFADGSSRVLRKPEVRIETATGIDTVVALRAAPLLFGWGLLESVEPEMLLPLDDPDDRNRDGISGRSRALRHDRKGVFGWKSTVADAKTQVATALYRDMGITTTPFVDAGHDGPELSDEDLQALTAFVRLIGVPDRMPESAQTRRGERHFGDAGCSHCHIPALMTTVHADPRLSEQLIWAYTDLMLHDLGKDLADPGNALDAAEWRTAPLWGIGVVEQLLPARGFLHDGRAADIEEAILWHGGEAAAAQSAYRALSRTARDDLLAYVRNL